ncbi:GNAT family N-acetyltransferase [Lactiplantibacillus garii]|uniref:GNAT family N-acetyltransferase n=1 Tax=Lactiplantibacillus garii TaxID=2306423 RepID=A0A426D508_9LACO|nr:GNAT family N-acetyltransferase [Lactiplantibacillus garii]RRK09671.1 GNAT family N-acetyltransferase [Lactiplantibacillus garii]
METSYQIFSARSDSDFAAIRQLYYDTWQSAYRNLIPASFLAQLSPQTWHPEQRWQNTMLAQDQQRRLVGVCSFGPARLAEFTGWGELYSIYVAPEYQNLGVGHQLLQQGVARLRASYERIYLLVLANNVAAQRFYQHLGFRDTGQLRTAQSSLGTLTERIFVCQPAENK